MRNKGMIGTILATILVITLAVILAVSYFLLKNYVILGEQLFPKNQETLDLRGQAWCLHTDRLSGGRCCMLP